MKCFNISVYLIADNTFTLINAFSFFFYTLNYSWSSMAARLVFIAKCFYHNDCLLTMLSSVLLLSLSILLFLFLTLMLLST